MPPQCWGFSRTTAGACHSCAVSPRAACRAVHRRASITTPCTPPDTHQAKRFTTSNRTSIQYCPAAPQICTKPVYVVQLYCKGTRRLARTNVQSCFSSHHHHALNASQGCNLRIHTLHSALQHSLPCARMNDADSTAHHTKLQNTLSTPRQCWWCATASQAQHNYANRSTNSATHLPAGMLPSCKP